MRNISIVTGSYPPMRCGVGDYSYNLARAIAAAGVHVRVYTSGQPGTEVVQDTRVEVHRLMRNWGGVSVWRLFRAMRRSSGANGAEWVNIQYPTIGYGYSLGPQLLAVLLRLFSDIKVISTLHEFRHARTLRKISLIPFLLLSHRLVFTAKEEAAAVSAWFPSFLADIGDKHVVIPVGSNIPVLKNIPWVDRRNRIVFFGLFYPGRLAEMVLEAFAVIASKMPEVAFGIIGDVHPKHARYYERLRVKMSGLLPSGLVEWHIGKSPLEIARILSESKAALLPYPDGASFRRTTLMAAMQAGVIVLSTKGQDTPSELRDRENIIFAADTLEFAEKAVAILSDPVSGDRISSSGERLGRAFSWDAISGKYIALLS